MCRRHMEQSFVTIPRLSEEQARQHSGAVFVVDVLCQNPACFYRDENLWERKARRRDKPLRPCGSFACLTVNRCCLVLLPPPTPSPLCLSETHKRKRYVLDEESVCL